MTKRENVLEKCRINLDKEKVLHSITRGEKEELQQRIDKAIEYIEEHKQKGYRIPMSDDYGFWNELNENEIKELLEILDKGE